MVFRVELFGNYPRGIMTQSTKNPRRARVASAPLLVEQLCGGEDNHYVCILLGDRRMRLTADEAAKLAPGLDELKDGARDSIRIIDRDGGVPSLTFVRLGVDSKIGLSWGEAWHELTAQAFAAFVARWHECADLASAPTIGWAELSAPPPTRWHELVEPVFASV